MLYAQVHLTLPAWVHDAVDTSRAYASDADKVALAILLSKHNVEAQSGGPFGAAVFGPNDRIISVGVNRVVPHDALGAETDRLAETLAAKLGAAVKIGKRAFYDQLPLDLAAAYDHTAAVMVENMLWRDTEEGISAFIEKRKPDWAE